MEGGERNGVGPGRGGKMRGHYLLGGWWAGFWKLNMRGWARMGGEEKEERDIGWASWRGPK